MTIGICTSTDANPKLSSLELPSVLVQLSILPVQMQIGYQLPFYQIDANPKLEGMKLEKIVFVLNF